MADGQDIRGARKYTEVIHFRENIIGLLLCKIVFGMSIADKA